MNIDKETLKKLLNLDDNTFKSKVTQAASASGIKDDRLDKMLGDVSNLKKVLGNLTESDLKKMAVIVGTDKVENVLENLKKNIK